MEANRLIISVIGAMSVTALGALLIWQTRRSAFQAGVAVTETKHSNALVEAQHEGDEIVAAKRDPLDVAEQLSVEQF